MTSSDEWALCDAGLLVLAYLLGSIPFSYLVARKWGVGDVRKVGSGNVGAANVMRQAGKAAGLTAFVLDFVKGAAAAFLAQRLAASHPLPALAAATAILGHMYPPWLGFRGGKGVATGAGAFLPLAPTVTGGALLAFVLTMAVSRYISLGSVVGTLTLPVLSFALGSPAPVRWTATAVAGLIIWKHRVNLQRILRGMEPRLGVRMPPPKP